MLATDPDADCAWVFWIGAERKMDALVMVTIKWGRLRLHSSGMAAYYRSIGSSIWAR